MDETGTEGEARARRPTRKLVVTTIAIVVATFVLIQFVPYRVDNPSTRDEPTWDSPGTRALAVRACFDCHSNESDVTRFEQVAPLSWWIANHVKEGRASLNFSEWHGAAGEEADDAAGPLAEGEMPPSYYTWLGMHSDAKLTPAEVKHLVDGLRRTIAADPPSSGGG
jgi:hypothetical protein